MLFDKNLKINKMDSKKFDQRIKTVMNEKMDDDLLKIVKSLANH